MGVSQKKIAEMLGITQATVSRALRDHPRLSPDLRAKVKSLCDELGYVPDFHAKSLASGRTRGIAVFMPSEGRLYLSYLHAEWVAHLHEAAQRLDYRLWVHHFSAYERTAQERSADGFVAIGVNNAILARVASCPVPVILTDCTLMRPTHVVSMDNGGGMASAVRHLIDLGHRSVAYFGSHTTPELNPSLERHMGYVRALNDFGLTAPARLTINTDGWIAEAEEAFNYEEELMRAVASGATAVVCSSDIGAIGVMRVLRHNGLRVPEDISVVGFDESILARSCDPPLTTVMQDLETASNAAISMLVAAIEENASPPSVVIPTRLLVRGTTAPPPAAKL